MSSPHRPRTRFSARPRGANNVDSTEIRFDSARRSENCAAGHDFDSVTADCAPVLAGDKSAQGVGSRRQSSASCLEASRPGKRARSSLSCTLNPIVCLESVGEFGDGCRLPIMSELRNSEADQCSSKKHLSSNVEVVETMSFPEQCPKPVLNGVHHDTRLGQRHRHHQRALNAAHMQVSTCAESIAANCGHARGGVVKRRRGRPRRCPHTTAPRPGALCSSQSPSQSSCSRDQMASDSRSDAVDQGGGGGGSAGAAVLLRGHVWRHIDAGGLLVVSVEWCGRQYSGTLLDCAVHQWAPSRPVLDAMFGGCSVPQVTNEPAVSRPFSRGRGRRRRRGRPRSSIRIHSPDTMAYGVDREIHVRDSDRIADSPLTVPNQTPKSTSDTEDSLRTPPSNFSVVDEDEAYSLVESFVCSYENCSSRFTCEKLLIKHEKSAHSSLNLYERSSKDVSECSMNLTSSKDSHGIASGAQRSPGIHRSNNTDDSLNHEFSDIPSDGTTKVFQSHSVDVSSIGSVTASSWICHDGESSSFVTSKNKERHNDTPTISECSADATHESDTSDRSREPTSKTPMTCLNTASDANNVTPDVPSLALPTNDNKSSCNRECVIDHQYKHVLPKPFHSGGGLSYTSSNCGSVPCLESNRSVLHSQTISEKSLLESQSDVIVIYENNTEQANGVNMDLPSILGANDGNVSASSGMKTCVLSETNSPEQLRPNTTSAICSTIRRPPVFIAVSSSNSSVVKNSHSSECSSHLTATTEFRNVLKSVIPQTSHSSVLAPACRIDNTIPSSAATVTNGSTQLSPATACSFSLLPGYQYPPGFPVPLVINTSIMDITTPSSTTVSHTMPSAKTTSSLGSPATPDGRVRVVKDGRHSKNSNESKKQSRHDKSKFTSNSAKTDSNVTSNGWSSINNPAAPVHLLNDIHPARDECVQENIQESTYVTDSRLRSRVVLTDAVESNLVPVWARNMAYFSGEPGSNTQQCEYVGVPTSYSDRLILNAESLPVPDKLQRTFHTASPTGVCFPLPPDIRHPTVATNWGAVHREPPPLFSLRPIPATVSSLSVDPHLASALLPRTPDNVNVLRHSGALSMSEPNSALVYARGLDPRTIAGNSVYSQVDMTTSMSPRLYPARDHAGILHRRQ